jgi:hypothetical protein
LVARCASEEARQERGPVHLPRSKKSCAAAAEDAASTASVCGHIHSAEITRFGDVTYYNDGDWVESCTALVEHPTGRIEILGLGRAAAGQRRRTAPVNRVALSVPA